MKKIISILLVLVLCFSATSVFAAPDIEKLFNAEYTDYEVVTELSLTLDKPLELLDSLSKLIDESLYSENILFTDIIDLRDLVESLFGSTQTMNMKCDISKDYKKVNIYLSEASNTPIKINKNLTITADAKSEMWINFDFSDIDNPIYKVIASAPASDRYMVMDYTKLFGDLDDDESLSAISSILNEEYIETINKISLDTLKKNAEISYKGGCFVIKMDDSQAKSWIIDIVYEALKLTNIPDVEFTEEQANQIKIMLSGIKIFGKNGIEMKYKANSKGIISAEESKISFDANLFDIFTLAGVSDIEGLTKDNSNIAFTIKTKSEYKKVNKDEKVKFPTLTEENTIEMFEFSESEYKYDDEEYVPQWEYVFFYTTEPPLEKGRVYVPLREFISALTEEDAYISWDNGTTTITSVTKFFNTITFSEGSCSVIKDGNEIILQEPIKTIDDKTALSQEFIDKVFGLDYFHVSYHYGSNEWSYGIDVINPDYTE